MPKRRCTAKARLKPVEKLCRQRNFGQQHQSLFAHLQCLRNRLEINFRLARTGNAIEQMRGKITGLHGRAQSRCDLTLLGRQAGLTMRRIGRVESDIAGQFMRR